MTSLSPVPYTGTLRRLSSVAAVHSRLRASHVFPTCPMTSWPLLFAKPLGSNAHGVLAHGLPVHFPPSGSVPTHLASYLHPCRPYRHPARHQDTHHLQGGLCREEEGRSGTGRSEVRRTKSLTGSRPSLRHTSSAPLKVVAYSVGTLNLTAALLPGTPKMSGSYGNAALNSIHARCSLQWRRY
jgi:hypothetical protein